jgi:hypothetical protein
MSTHIEHEAVQGRSLPTSLPFLCSFIFSKLMFLFIVSCSETLKLLSRKVDGRKKMLGGGLLPVLKQVAERYSNIGARFVLSGLVGQDMVEAFKGLCFLLLKLPVVNFFPLSFCGPVLTTFSSLHFPKTSLLCDRLLCNGN